MVGLTQLRSEWLLSHDNDISGGTGQPGSDPLRDEDSGKKREDPLGLPGDREEELRYDMTHAQTQRAAARPYLH